MQTRAKLKSAASRNQAADPPQLLQEDPAPLPLHHRTQSGLQGEEGGGRKTDVVSPYFFSEVPSDSNNYSLPYEL
ncbi:hypothetical protein FQN60_011032 [Etheostoma spectabile]|uniref:Uncharacterized protein n=1 Tax=Etheostoma spectabile TaxID=54343 RepID=A0A5J5DR60_9PERO|nr:hypothetical protein FQN60_011032 [Etheostoma spectabile]